MPKLKYLIDDLKDVAITRGGKCLSMKYIGSLEKYKWQCVEGHQWSAIWNSVRRGKWCPECRGDLISKNKLKNTIKDLIKLINHRGKLDGDLSPDLKIGVNEIFTIYGNCGHQWTTSYHRVRIGNWCRVCSYETIRKKTLKADGLKVAKKIALERNGKLLTKKYDGSQKKMSWKCNYCNDKWEANLSNVRLGTWCPNCSSGKSEKLIRQFFEKAFKHKFPKSRPGWLEGLELDGFSSKLGIAFEHQGDQHYKKHKFFTKRNLKDIQKSDKKKNELCKLKGVRLIIVPQVIHKLSYEKVALFLDKEVERYELVPFCKFTPPS